MKKKYLYAIVPILLLSIGLTACSGKKENNATTSQHAKAVKSIHQHHHKVKNKKARIRSNEKKTDSSKKETKTSTNTGSNQQVTSQSQPKTQGQINMERGYDPNGAPLLPGQDHAAGSNPDGSPDAWVQGQIDWAKRNGYMNADGSPTQKERNMEAQVENDSFGEDIPQMSNPGE